LHRRSQCGTKDEKPGDNKNGRSYEVFLLTMIRSHSRVPNTGPSPHARLLHTAGQRLPLWKTSEKIKPPPGNLAVQMPLSIWFLRVRCPCVQHAMAGPNKFRPASHQLSALDPRILTSGPIRTVRTHKESASSRKFTRKKAEKKPWPPGVDYGLVFCFSQQVTLTYRSSFCHRRVNPQGIRMPGRRRSPRSRLTNRS